MQGIITAITTYESQYGRMPASTKAFQSISGTNVGGCPDFSTFGTVYHLRPGNSAVGGESVMLSRPAACR